MTTRRIRIVGIALVPCISTAGNRLDAHDLLAGTGEEEIDEIHRHISLGTVHHTAEQRLGISRIAGIAGDVVPTEHIFQANTPYRCECILKRQAGTGITDRVFLLGIEVSVEGVETHMRND